MAALTSRSWIIWQCEHFHIRSSSVNRGFETPQPEQIFELANHWDTFTKRLPCSFVLYFNFDIKLYQPASPIVSDNLLFFSIFLTANVSTTIAWFSSTSRLDNLCWKSAREFATFSWAFANLIRAFSLPLLPIWQRDKALCFLLKLSFARFKYLGLLILFPLESTTISERPKSTPKTLFNNFVTGSTTDCCSTTINAKYLPVDALFTVILLRFPANFLWIFALIALILGIFIQSLPTEMLIQW